MKVTQDRIEDAVVRYILANKTQPRYLLIDEKSYDEFSKSFTPVQKVSQSKQADPKIAKFSTTYNCTLDIMPVKTDQEMFELVR